MKRNGSVFGYELLFRNSEMNSAYIKDALYASSITMINLMNKFGINNILGSSPGFFNTNNEILESDIIDIIPKNKFILEILENSVVDRSLIKRVDELKAKGYIFALDDFVFEKKYFDSFMPLFEKVSYIKVDFPFVDKESLSKKMPILKKLNVKLLAEKVETHEDFKFCKDLGFDYFQGYYFAKPSILTTKSIDPSKLEALKIAGMISGDCNIGKIVKEFNYNPELSLNLLKFMNSAQFAFKSKINSIRHAVNLIGMDSLKKWLLLLSYVTSNKNGVHSPLFQMAAARAKLMELLSLHIYPLDKSKSDEAFFIGMLSLISTLCSAPEKEIFDNLNLDDTIKKSLLLYDGFYGDLLKVALSMDSDKFTNDAEIIMKKLSIDASTLRSLELESYAWVNNFLKNSTA